MADYYSILGVSKNATQDEIKSAYKRKVVEWHPDRNKSKEAPDMIKSINKSYEVLSDSQKRQMYDQVGHNAYESGGYGSASGGPQGWPGGGYSYTSGDGYNVDFGGSGFEDIFETFFGGSPFGGGRGRKPRREIYEVQLTFEEAISGVTKQTVIAGKTRDIKIPSGVDTGMRVRFDDFDIQVRVKPHQFFKREGQDIHYVKDISYSQAVLGAEVVVPQLEGSIKLKVRPGTKSGQVVRLSGKGVQDPQRHNTFGDFYVVYNIVVPTSVSSKAKKLLEDLQKEGL